MRTQAAPLNRSRKGCGQCGGAKPCHCQDACDERVDDGTCGLSGFSYPNFFAGQLLAEEDLQDLTAHGLAKSRLRNRHLVGDGVVCGLEAHIDPCNPRQVNIAPGYALDCDGNDIVLPCPVNGLDIIQMIRDLRTRRRGQDCGDPCEKPSAEKTPGDVPRAPVSYDLYVRYCETRSEWLMPYEVEACSAASCKPARIQEGYAFELRCAPVPRQESDKQKTAWSDPSGPTLASRLSKCLQNQDFQALTDRAVSALRTFEAVHRGSIRAQKIFAIKDAGLDPIGNLNDILQKLRSATLQTQRVRLLNEALAWLFRTNLITRTQQQQEQIRQRANEIHRSIEDLKSDPRHQAQAEFLAARHKKFGATDPLTALNLEQQLLIAGEMALREEVDGAVSTLKVLKELMTRWLTEGMLFVDPGLETPLRRLEFTPFKDEPQIEEVREKRWSALILGHALLQHFSHCFCEVVLPPCASCEDPAVLLARLDVDLDTCTVTQACNLQRRVVLTGPALRYWFAQAQSWFQAFRDLCCPRFEERQKVLQIEERFKQEVKQWGADFKQAADLHLEGPSSGPTEVLVGLGKQVAPDAGQTFSSVAQAVGVFGVEQAEAVDLAVVQEAVELLQNQAMGRIDGLSSKVERLTQHSETLPARWQKLGMQRRNLQKAFLREEFRLRLNPDGLKQVEDNSLEELMGLDHLSKQNVLLFDTLSPAQQLAIPSAFVGHLIQLEPEETDGLKDKIDDKLNAYWQALNELRFLMDQWPESTMSAGDIT